MSEPILLRLTVEELCLLQGSLGIDVLPGLQADLLFDLNTTERTQALRTAAHTLRARGLVGRDGTQRPCIHPEVARLLLDYAHPHSTLFVDTYVASTRVIPFFYIIGKQAIYEQCQPEPDVIQFRLLNLDDLWKRLSPNLSQTNSSYNEPFSPFQGEIIQSVLNEGITLVHEDQERAAQLFSNFLPQPLAQKLVAAYHKLQVVQYIARWEQTPTAEYPTPHAALTILQGQEHSFLLWVEKPGTEDETLVTIRPATSTFLQASIMRFVPLSIYT